LRRKYSMDKRRRYVWMALAMLIVFSLACNMPARNSTPEGTEVAAGSATPSLITSATMTPSSQSAGTPTPTPTEAPPVEGEDGCTLRAAYVTDVTIPDDTKLAKDAEFVKTWRIRNSGTCTWKEGTKFVYASGEALGAPVSVAVSPTEPNAQVDISASMKAPATPGTYRSNWQLESPTGKRYGGVFYVQIVVEGPVTPTPTVTVTPGAATPPTNLAGTVATDCSKVDFAWTGATGETGYKMEGPGLTESLPADTVSYTWNSPPAGSSTVTLIAVAQGGAEIGRVSTTVNVACGTSKPDLIVDSITFAPSPPVAYLSLQVTVQVRNLGPGDSGPFVLRWWGGKNFASVSCEWNVNGGLTAGSMASLICDNYKYSSPYGSIETKAYIDPDNGVAEANEDNNILEENISVSSPQTVYDFVAKGPVASWQSGDPTTNLSWNGAPGDTQGFARWATGQLETGNAMQGQCLETHPKWVNDGWITGAYTDLYNNEGYVVQAGDVFRASVGFLQGAAAGNVTYKVTLRTTSSGSVTIAQVADTYGDGLKTISVDLTPYAGQGADIILRVDAGANADQDWACWLQAVIYRYP
jgi:hypothetical protein